MIRKMDDGGKKQIIKYINYHFTSFTVSDLIFRILGLILCCILFILSIKIVEPVEIVIETGYFSIFASDTKGYTIFITSFVIFIIVSIMHLYKINKKWSIWCIRGISTAFNSINLLLCSCFIDFRFDFAIEDWVYILLKITFFILSAILYTLYLFKYRIPKFNNKNDGNAATYIILIVSVSLIARPILLSLELSANVFLPAIEYILSVCLLLYTIDSLSKAYYAKILMI